MTKSSQVDQDLIKAIAELLKLILVLIQEGGELTLLKLHSYGRREPPGRVRMLQLGQYVHIFDVDEVTVAEAGEVLAFEEPGFS